jgi:hypothetical protein
VSTEQHDADAYGQELARISHHQHEATNARFTVFQALAAAGIAHEQTDEIMGRVGGASWPSARRLLRVVEARPRGTPARGGSR